MASINPSKQPLNIATNIAKRIREAKDNNLLLENKIDKVRAKNESIQNENDLLKAQIAEINSQIKALNMLAMN